MGALYKNKKKSKDYSPFFCALVAAQRGGALQVAKK
jgi:hypothetical protein